jgi:hypothetical protein
LPKAISELRVTVLKSRRIQAVFSKRKCQRCGVKQQKRFSEDAQGNKTPISGWEKTKRQ